MKKSSKRLILGGVVLLAVGGIIFRVISGNKKEPDFETRPTVVVENPVKEDIVLYTDLTGLVEPMTRASVLPKMAGEVLEVNFQAGDTVEAGQTLIRIDSDALTALKLSMDSAAVAADTAARELARIEPLYAGGYVSQQQYDQAKDGATSASLGYESAKNQYELQLKYTTVTAPISGVIESRKVEPHDHVSPSGEICVISGSDQAQIKFGITEKTLGNMSVGDKIQVSKNGSDYEGQIIEVGTMVNSATGLYDVKASVAQADSLTNGTRVKLTVVMDQALGALTVPVDAVSYDNGQPFVYCYNNGIAEKTPIEAGIYDADSMEVKSGLTADSQVITSWSNELVEGAEVLLEQETAAGSAQADAASDTQKTEESR